MSQKCDKSNDKKLLKLYDDIFPRTVIFSSGYLSHHYSCLQVHTEVTENKMK